MNDEISEQLDFLEIDGAEMWRLAEQVFKAGRPEEYEALRASIEAGTVQVGVDVHLLPARMALVWAMEYGGARQVIVTVRPGEGARLLN